MTTSSIAGVRCLLWVAVTMMAVVALCGCGSDPRVATVGTSHIAESQVRHWATILARTEGSSKDERVTREYALGFLIRSAWVTAEARRLGVGVSPQEVRDRLNLLVFEQTHGAKLELLPRDAVLRHLLLAPSTTASERESLMRLNLLAMKVEGNWLVQAAREIPRGDTAAYYSAHRSQFVEPAVSDIEIVGNFDEAKVLRAKREIESGKPFLEVARHAGEDSEAPGGLQHLIRGREEPPFERHIFGAKPHVLTGPFRQAITYIFEVLRAKPDRQQMPTEVASAINRKLAPRRVASVLRPAFEAAWTERTRCRATYVVRGCREYGH